MTVTARKGSRAAKSFMMSLSVLRDNSGQQCLKKDGVMRLPGIIPSTAITKRMNLEVCTVYRDGSGEEFRFWLRRLDHILSVGS